MLRIRPEQMAAMSEYMTQRFEDRMLVYVRSRYSQQCEGLDEPGTREWIRQGIKHSKEYEIVSERDVCGYIELMFELGRDFDTDPNRPWAGTILQDRASPHPCHRFQRLRRAAEEHEAAGED